MKVLVTGGTGFVGSHVCRQLLAAGHEVRLLVRDRARAQVYCADTMEGSPEFVVGDITDEASVLSALSGCDAVVHAAAVTPSPAISIEQMFAANVDGVKHVVGCAVNQGVERIVCVSSITAIFNTDAAKVNAEAALVPSSMPYGKSKIEGERYLRDLQAGGVPLAIVYPGGVIGPDDPGFSATFTALKHRMENGFRIFGDGGMQHIDVRDLAGFICSLVERGGAGRFPLPGVYCRWAELADIVEQVSGCRLQRIPAQGWKLRLLGRCLDFLRLFKTVETPISAETMRYATQWPNIDNSPELLRRGLTLRSTQETFSDAIAWMVRAGHLEAERCPAVDPTAH